MANAVKFTDAGEILLSVECGNITRSRARLTCEVIDTGVGIEPAKQRQIFRAFEQADNSTTRRYGGTGLGLAICSRLVKAMGGEIGVISKPGAGSTFSFTIALPVASKPLDVTGPRSTRAIEGASVLVVDDNATNRRILEEMLRNWRMHPVTATGVEEAIALLRAAANQGRPFDLLLTDSHMPDHDGFELARTIGDDERLRNTLIMMLSSGGRPDDVGRCQELGITNYLLKPIKQSELFDAIAKAFNLVTTSDADAVPVQDGRAPQLGSLRILLAEDSLVNQKLAVGLLEKHGHTVDVVENGTAAVRAVRKQSYDLVLMDIQMPEMDGLEATRVIREMECIHGGHLPIVAMTAHAMKGDRERCLSAGMDGYVAKPIRAKDVFATINRVLCRSEEQETGEA